MVSLLLDHKSPMKAVLVLLALVAVALAVRVDYKVKVHKNTLPVITKGLVESINAQGKWKADLNKGSVVDGINFEQAKALMGALKGSLFFIAMMSHFQRR